MFPNWVYAQEEGGKYDYTVLAPLPGTTIDEECGPQDTTCKASLQSYLPGLFNLLVGLSAVFAVLMIVIGGFQYMSSDAIKGKSDGRERIKNSVVGLLFVLGAWLILATINPNLLKLNLDIETIKVEVPQGSLTALQPLTRAALDALGSECTGCTLRITSTTGGSHTPGSAHYQGRAVDFGADSGLTRFITGSTSNPEPCKSFPKTVGNVRVVFLWEPRGARCGQVASSGDHWHMQLQ